MEDITLLDKRKSLILKGGVFCLCLLTTYFTMSGQGSYMMI